MVHLNNNRHIQDSPIGHLVWPHIKWFFLSYNPITIVTSVWHHSLLIMTNSNHGRWGLNPVIIAVKYGSHEDVTH
jgi:branched-subunit amino acid transport protein